MPSHSKRDLFVTQLGCCCIRPARDCTSLILMMMILFSAYSFILYYYYFVLLLRLFLIMGVMLLFLLLLSVAFVLDISPAKTVRDLKRALACGLLLA